MGAHGIDATAMGMARTIVADAVIEMLAASEVEQAERIVRLETDLAIFRELTCAAFDALRANTVRLTRVQAERDRLRDERRQWREDHLLRAGADDAERGAA
jgi:hypothetical protein